MALWHERESSISRHAEPLAVISKNQRSIVIMKRTIGSVGMIYINKSITKKTVTLLALLLILPVVLTACGKIETQEGKQEVSHATGADPQKDSISTVDKAESEQQSSFPLTVKDANGYEMTIASEPSRIVSLTLGSDEMLMGLIDHSRIAALTRYANDESISNIAREAKNISARATMDDIEGVIALNPDLVIVDTWADSNYVKQLRDSGINVYAFSTPCNIDEQKKVITELAHITGADDKGIELIEWINSKLAEVDDRLSKLKPEDKLTVMDYGEIGSSGIGTNFDDIVTRAGLVNVVAKAGMKDWPVVSKEKMIELDPQIIILPSWYYDQSKSLDGMINELKGDESLQTISAIKNDRLIAVPNPHISAISQYVVLAVEDVAKAAYPKLFE